MSSLASRGGYRNSYHNGNRQYVSNNGELNTKGSGNTCINNEDFNGTTFGEFTCPMPEFDPSAKYCCGSHENQTQFCCQFFDE